MITAVLLTLAVAQGAIAIEHVSVIDASDSVPRHDQTVIVQGHRIVAVTPSASARVPAGARRLDGRSRFLIPGLWDMHVHTVLPGGRLLLQLYVANGVTGVRDMASDWDSILAHRRVIARWLPGPRIVASGPYIEGGDIPIAHILARTPEEGVRAVDSLRRLGVDFVKVHGQLRPETYFAIARRARELGMPFSGHVSRRIGSAAASDSGQRSIEHLLGIPLPCTAAESVALAPRYSVQSALGTCTSEALEPLYARFVRNRTWVTPTLTAAWEIASWPLRDMPGDTVAAFIPRQTRAFVTRLFDIFPPPDSVRPGTDSVGRAVFGKRLIQVAAMHRAGVRILTGTDAPLRNSPPGFGLHEELLLLVRAGLSPFAALEAATLEPARYLGMQDSLGTIEPGKLADLVLLSANPLDDIRNTSRIVAVIANGRLLDSAARARILRPAR